MKMSNSRTVFSKALISLNSAPRVKSAYRAAFSSLVSPCSRVFQAGLGSK